MAKKFYEEQNIINIARAIQIKRDTSASFSVAGMASEIGRIKTQHRLQNLVCSENGTYNPSIGFDAFSNVIVSVNNEESVLGEKTIEQNGTYIASQDGYDGYSKVTVSVNTSEEQEFSNDYVEGKLTSLYNSDVSYIAENAFCGMSLLSYVNVPAVIDIHHYAFARCENLSTIIAPSCVIIGSWTFMSCQKLESISFPLCEEIRDVAFYSISALSDVYIPKCKKLYQEAFISCWNLKEIYLPDCSSLSCGVFAYCSSLESVYLLSSAVCFLDHPSYYSDIWYRYEAFANTPITDSSFLGYYGSIYVPWQLVNTYKTHSMWSRYSDRITSYIS